MCYTPAGLRSERQVSKLQLFEGVRRSSIRTQSGQKGQDHSSLISGSQIKNKIPETEYVAYGDSSEAEYRKEFRSQGSEPAVQNRNVGQGSCWRTQAAQEA